MKSAFSLKIRLGLTSQSDCKPRCFVTIRNWDQRREDNRLLFLLLGLKPSFIAVRGFAACVLDREKTKETFFVGGTNENFVAAVRNEEMLAATSVKMSDSEKKGTKTRITSRVTRKSVLHVQSCLPLLLPSLLKVMLHETIRNVDFYRNTAL